MKHTPHVYRLNMYLADKLIQSEHFMNTFDQFMFPCDSTK